VINIVVRVGGKSDDEMGFWWLLMRCCADCGVTHVLWWWCEDGRSIGVVSSDICDAMSILALD
jgi:hypothetical protein